MSTYNLIWLLWQLQQDASNRVWSRKSGPKTRKQDMAYALLSSAPCSSPFPLFTDRCKMRCATLADTHMTYQHLLTHISHGYILLLTHICDMCDVARHGILLLHPLADTHITWHPLATSSCYVLLLSHGILLLRPLATSSCCHTASSCYVLLLCFSPTHKRAFMPRSETCVSPWKSRYYCHRREVTIDNEQIATEQIFNSDAAAHLSAYAQEAKAGTWKS